MNASQNDIKNSISEMLRELFSIHRERKQLKLDFEDEHVSLKDEFTRKDSPLAEREAVVKAELYDFVVASKLVLLTGKLKSFALAYGKISFKAKPVSFKIIDKIGLEAQARKDGNLKKLGKLELVWTGDPKLLEEWLKSNPDEAKKYEVFVKRGGGFDEVFASPNDSYITTFDPNRLSDKSVKLEPAKQEEDAEDA